MKRWDKGGELKITDLRLSFASVFCLLLLYIPHDCEHALRKESTIKRSVNDLEHFDDQCRKSACII